MFIKCIDFLFSLLCSTTNLHTYFEIYIHKHFNLNLIINLHIFVKTKTLLLIVC